MAAETIYIYAMGSEDGPSKIGIASNPEERLNGVQRASNKVICVTGQWPVGKRIALAVERHIHWQLRDRHFKGEWFNVHLAEATAAIERALSLQAQFDHRELIPPLQQRGLPGGEHIRTAFPRGTKKLIDAALVSDEGRADFIREAINREIKRRRKALGDGGPGVRMKR